MDPMMERLDIHSDFGAFEDYFERFEIWAITKEDDEDVNTVAHSLTFIGKEAYSLLRTLAMPEKPISLPYTILKELQLDYVHAQAYAGKNLLRSCDTLHEDWHQFDQCLSCGKFHSFNSCKFRNSKCLKCDDVGHIQSVCNTIVHLAATNIKSYMVFSNDSLISDEIPCKSEQNMLNESSHDRKLDVVLIDANFSNDPLLCNDILNKFEETISEESNLDVISYITYPHNAFVACGKLAQCETRVLNELDLDYNSDDLISTAVFPYHKKTSNVYSSQCEKCVLNEATLFITV
ncbi:unnamed protein product [Schistosoma curassoni]|uniref:CCHC-type domain-containing protein n=1 Tax=Schistosoma curassoni TaxID=6186 RepID=A0A183L714_9TREM|nr:unnamed protein product [Schistosoma curassoni]